MSAHKKLSNQLLLFPHSSRINIYFINTGKFVRWAFIHCHMQRTQQVLADNEHREANTLLQTWWIDYMWFVPTAMKVAAQSDLSHICPWFTVFIYFFAETPLPFCRLKRQECYTYTIFFFLKHPPSILSTWSEILISLLHNHWTMIYVLVIAQSGRLIGTESVTFMNRSKPCGSYR